MCNGVSCETLSRTIMLENKGQQKMLFIILIGISENAHDALTSKSKMSDRKMGGHQDFDQNLGQINVHNILK